MIDKDDSFIHRARNLFKHLIKTNKIDAENIRVSLISIYKSANSSRLNRSLSINRTVIFQESVVF